jgi:hypothetical protein
MPTVDNGNARPSIEELTKDPRYKAEKDWLWSAFDAYVAEKKAEELAANPPKKDGGFLDGLLGPFA